MTEVKTRPLEKGGVRIYLEVPNFPKEFAFADIVRNGNSWELETIGVLPDYRLEGWGWSVFCSILQWMDEHNIRNITFLNQNDDFWQAMKRNRPRRVFLSKNMEGYIRGHS